jgi:4-amino-4-deoxy-L-arabinose transferase-like glycosyltransferase
MQQTVRNRTLLLGAAALLAAFTYLYGLDDVGIPSNGDENVYIHLARLTAASGHWLPLATDVETERNTKPPLLFWQGIASTAQGASWTLWRLRLPNALYTLGIAAMLLALLRRLTGQWQSGALAVVIYLAFYSSYRYGRPFLTDAPEAFWLTLPVVAVLWSRGALLESRVSVPLMFGVLLGIACLYKSFALIVPFGLMLALWHWVRHGESLKDWLAHAAPAVAISTVVALAIFGLWPLLDPDPGAIWRDFVLKENAGKFDSSSGLGHYVLSFLWGGSSVFSLFVSLLGNAALLAPIFIALIIDAWRSRRQLSQEERLLWVCVIAYFIAFAIPSQRDGRYLLPAMPAIAALATLAWARLPAWGFLATTGFATLFACVLATLSILFLRQAGGDLVMPLVFWALLAGMLTLGVASLIRPSLARVTAPVLCVALLLAMGLSLTAYASPRGAYATATRARLAGEAVFFPCDWLATEEAERFLLPGADVRSYNERDGLTLDQLAARYHYFAAYAPLDETPQCEGCRVLDKRYLVRGRRTSEIAGKAPASAVLKQFFERLVLIESQRAPREIPPPIEACIH